MIREIAPSTIAPTVANYAHAVLCVSTSRPLYTSGVVGIRPDGTVPEEIAAQAEVVWVNLIAILTEAKMTIEHVASITTYVVVDHLAALPQVMAARDRALQGRRVASTLVTVPALARPEWKLEISLIAAS